jgi:hypothetical protein
VSSKVGIVLHLIWVKNRRSLNGKEVSKVHHRNMFVRKVEGESSIIQEV